MSTVVTHEPPQTIADLVERLDGVPTERIRLVPTPGTATEDELLRLLERDKIACELVDGTLLEKTVGWDESEVGVEIAFQLKLFCRESGCGGAVCGADAPYRLSTSNVRLPDVSYTSPERVPPRGERGRVAQWAPDLAIEVLSESNTKREMDRKLGEYFASGVRLVWYVDPPTRTIRVFTAPDAATELGEDDTLDGGDVLPGFELAVRELFDNT